MLYHGKWHGCFYEIEFCDVISTYMVLVDQIKTLFEKILVLSKFESLHLTVVLTIGTGSVLSIKFCLVKKQHQLYAKHRIYVGYTSMQSLLAMHPRNRLGTSLYFKVTFQVCFVV